jgi:glucose/arabinose dehydrogenase
MHKALEFDALVALRGSWGTQPGGGALGNPATRRAPKIVAVRFEDGRAKRVDDLLTGFQLDDGERWARPVGVAIGPDGALYFTSDSGINGLFRLRKVR